MARDTQHLGGAADVGMITMRDDPRALSPLCLAGLSRLLISLLLFIAACQRDPLVYVPLPPEVTYPWVTPHREATARASEVAQRHVGHALGYAALRAELGAAEDRIAALERGCQRSERSAVARTDRRVQDDRPDPARTEQRTEDPAPTGTSSGEGSPRINVNTATADALETLPRIGPAMAARIIDARPFDTVDDLTRVRGIGPATLERLRDRVRTE